MEETLPKRKQNRLKNYDYSQSGAYFITICTEERKPILSKIVGGGALDAPHTELTAIGKIAQKHLLSSEKIDGVRVDCYVIMPDHIHAIIFIGENGGTSRAPSPTNKKLPRVISAFKRFCNQEMGTPLFQRSYYDHVIRNQEEYEEHVKYIYENPARRYFADLATKKDKDN